MCKILVVDDAKLMRSMINKTLAQYSENIVLEAKDGIDAISMYKLMKPDVVTMDITMNCKNGIDAAKEIIEYDPDAKIVMVTALGKENLLKECVRAGVKDYIVKPFTSERLLSALKKALH